MSSQTDQIFATKYDKAVRATAGQPIEEPRLTNCVAPQSAAAVCRLAVPRALLFGHGVGVTALCKAVAMLFRLVAAAEMAGSLLTGGGAVNFGITSFWTTFPRFATAVFRSSMAAMINS